MFGAADEGGEETFGEVFAGEAGADGAAAVIDYDGGVVEGFGHCCEWGRGGERGVGDVVSCGGLGMGWRMSGWYKVGKLHEAILCFH